MDKTIVGLIGAVSALAAATPSQAAPTQLADIMRVSSYADLLKPVPNATEVLKASDEAQAAESDATLQMAQYDGGGYGYGHRRYHHHHHHHHHHGYGPRFFVNPYGYGYHHHYHHHHHHRRYDYGY